MKRIVLALLAVAALLFVARAIRRALVSDETKIRWLVADMADGFGRTRMDPILAGIARDFQDETSGADRDTLRQALAYLFFTAKDEATKRFPYRVEAGIARLEIDRGVPETPGASCDVTARFYERHGEQENLAWEIEVSARLSRGEDGWRILRTSYETRSGRMLR